MTVRVAAPTTNVDITGLESNKEYDVFVVAVAEVDGSGLINPSEPSDVVAMTTGVLVNLPFQGCVGVGIGVGRDVAYGVCAIVLSLFIVLLNPFGPELIFWFNF